MLLAAASVNGCLAPMVSWYAISTFAREREGRFLLLARGQIAGEVQPTGKCFRVIRRRNLRSNLSLASFVSSYASS